MPPAPPDELGLRLAIAAERLAGLHGELSGRMAAVEGKLDTVDKALTAHRAEVRPALDAHAAYLARLQAAENEAAAEAVANSKTAGERAKEAEGRAREAAAKEQEERAKARAETIRLVVQIAGLIVALALAAAGGAKLPAMLSTVSAPTPNPAQDAPGVTP